MPQHEMIIVTIQFGKEQFDIEVPAFMPIGALTDKLEETLRMMFPAQNIDSTNCMLKYNDATLSEEKHLAHYGIWDGSILECVLKGA